MVFKQKILEESKISGIILLFLILVIPAFLPIAMIANGEKLKYAALVYCISFFVLMIIYISIIHDYEWFCVYDDKIEARSLFGRKNSVSFSDVEYIEETIIFVGAKLTKKYYIFIDGREEKINRKKWTNKRKRSFRIYKTPELENFLKEKNIEIRYVKPYWQ